MISLNQFIISNKCIETKVEYARPYYFNINTITKYCPFMTKNGETSQKM